MTSEQIIFILISVITVGSGLAVVINRNLFQAALALMLSFLGVAGIYVTLDAGFLAASQLLVYIGAISILLIFAIMLTRRMMQAHESPFNSQVGLGLVTAVAAFAMSTYAILQFWGNASVADAFAGKPEVDATVLRSTIASMGQSLVDPDGFVLPFIIASVLLLAALIGAIFIAWPRQDMGMVEDES